MKTEIAEALKNLSDVHGIPCEIHESYSGRGMFGKKEAGISFGNTGDIITLFVLLAEDGEFSSSQIIGTAKGLRFDSLGRDTICY